MSEGNWSENGCWVGVSSTAQGNSQGFGTQWESKIGLSENNLHRFGAGVDAEVQTLKKAFSERRNKGEAGKGSVCGEKWVPAARNKGPCLQDVP